MVGKGSWSEHENTNGEKLTHNGEYGVIILYAKDSLIDNFENSGLPFKITKL